MSLPAREHLEPPKREPEIVVDRERATWSDLWTKEDYWAIWLGVLLLVMGVLLFLPNAPKDMHAKLDAANAVMRAEQERAPFRTVAWHDANDAKGKLKARDEQPGKAIGAYLAKPQGWKGSPLDALYLGEGAAAARREKGTQQLEALKGKTRDARAAAEQAESAAAAAGFARDDLNAAARAAIGDWGKARQAESKAKSAAGAKPYNLVPRLLVLMIGIGLLFSIGMKFMGRGMGPFLRAFPGVFVLAVFAYLLAAHTTVKAYGLEYVLWGVLIGLLISNTLGTPKWLMPAVQTEFYIKTGLVLLGASILFGKVLLIGMPGIFVAWVVTPIVLVSTYWFGQRIVKMPSRTLNITISSDMSVCGVSAAIATAAACRAKKEELTLAVGLSLAFTAVMMFAMPTFIKAVGMHHVLGGAWMGGTIDATGAVVAAGAILGPQAMYVAATVKMIQNILIGVIAFAVAAYWATRVERTAAGVDLTAGGAAREIWLRFPKFVLGFIGASIVFSLIYSGLGNDVGKVLIDEGVVKGWTAGLQGWFFALAFVSIGLATNFRELGQHFKGGKPLILYVAGQSLNLVLTLVMAYLMFFVVFPEITEKIMKM
jgi:uncharacterized membrane protein YadS